MKNYKQLLEQLPNKTVVFAFGRFNPPTNGHELLVKAVKTLAASHKADHAIYASKSQDAKKNPLTVEKKVHYLKLMFPRTNFVAASANVRTFIEAAKELNKKYKNLIMVAGSDRIPEYQRILHQYNGKEFNFDSIQVISAGERDPDSDDASGMSASKMRAFAAKGDFQQFKQGLPSSMREIDGRKLMNDVRQGMGLETIREQIKFAVDKLREKYVSGKIFQIGQFVETDNKRYEILDRGTNYLVVVDSLGETHRKWLTDVTLSENQIQEDITPGYAPSEISFKGYTTKNFHHTPNAAKAFQQTIQRAGAKDPVAVLNAIKATDTFLSMNDKHVGSGEGPTEQEVGVWKTAHEKAKESLDRIGEFLHHEDYWHMHQHEIEMMLGNYKEEGKGEMQEELTNKTIKGNDKVKVARIIATMLGYDDAESMSSPEQLVNMALRKVKNKALNPEALSIVNKMLVLASEVGIKYDGTLKPQKLKEEHPTPQKMGSTLHPIADVNPNADQVRKMKIKKKLGEAMDDFKKAAKEAAAAELAAKQAKEKEALAAKQEKEKERLTNEELEEAKKKKPPEVRDDSKQLGATQMHAYDAMFEESGECEEEEGDENEESELSKMADEMKDDDFMDAYEDDELGVIDDETGEECEEDEESEKLKEESLLEVLSRIERIKARVRLAKTKSKRERATRIALKRYSSPATINKRARRLAIKLMKQRMVRGRDVNKLSVGEKERIEKSIEKRKSIISRIAMRLAPRIRKVEKARLSHSKYTKGDTNSAV